MYGRRGEEWARRALAYVAAQPPVQHAMAALARALPAACSRAPRLDGEAAAKGPSRRQQLVEQAKSAEFASDYSLVSSPTASPPQSARARIRLPPPQPHSNDPGNDPAYPREPTIFTVISIIESQL